MPFVIIWSEQAQKDLSKLEKHVAERIIDKIEYANQAGLLRLEKVVGRNFYKYRVGDYRLFIDKRLADAIEIIAIRERENAYD